MRISARSSALISVAALALAFGLAPGAAPAEDETRVIQLKHRPAAEIAPILKPLLGPNDAISGTDFRLIVRTSDKNLHAIERVLAQLDVARRRLKITVKQAVVTDRAQTDQSLSGEAGKEVRITLPRNRPKDDKGLTVGGDLRYQTKTITTAARDETTQLITTQDGQRAHIRVGQSVPHVRRILMLSGGQGKAAQGVEFQNVTTGFDVVPRVQGETVHLEITPRLSTLDNAASGLVSFQEYSTTVTAKLGEWVDLGAITGAGEELRREILDSAGARAGERRTILIKVEENRNRQD